MYNDLSKFEDINKGWTINSSENSVFDVRVTNGDIWVVIGDQDVRVVIRGDDSDITITDKSELVIRIGSFVKLSIEYIELV